MKNIKWHIYKLVKIKSKFLMQFMAHVATALISHMQLVRFLIIFHFNLNTCWRQKYVAVRDLWETSSTVLAGKRKYCWILQKYIKSCGSFSSLHQPSRYYHIVRVKARAIERREFLSVQQRFSNQPKQIHTNMPPFFLAEVIFFNYC